MKYLFCFALGILADKYLARKERHKHIEQMMDDTEAAAWAQVENAQ